MEYLARASSLNNLASIDLFSVDFFKLSSLVFFFFSSNKRTTVSDFFSF